MHNAKAIRRSKLKSAIMLGFSGRLSAGIRSVALSGLVILFATLNQSVADESHTSRLLTGKPLSEALQHRRSLNLTGRALSDAIADLRQNTNIAICRDRRLDPSRPVNVTTQYVTCRQIFQSLAQAIPGAAVSITDRCVFVGPEIASDRLRTLMELRHQDVLALRGHMDGAAYRAVVQPGKVSWPNLSEPRQLLIDAASTAGLTMENPELVPHDLWSAMELPVLSFVDFATLVLNQFDLTFELSHEGIVKLVPVPPRVVIERRIRVPSKNKPRVGKRWATSFPDLDVTWRGSTAIVLATVETHEQLIALIRDDAKLVAAADGLPTRLFTMKVQGASYRKVIEKFREIGVPIRVEGKSGAALDELLSREVVFDLSKTPGSEFFEGAFAGLGADVAVADNEVVLFFP